LLGRAGDFRHPSQVQPMPPRASPSLLQRAGQLMGRFKR
jgi:hypothetical protein